MAYWFPFRSPTPAVEVFFSGVNDTIEVGLGGGGIGGGGTLGVAPALPGDRPRLAFSAASMVAGVYTGSGGSLTYSGVVLPVVPK